MRITVFGVRIGVDLFLKTTLCRDRILYVLQLVWDGTSEADLDTILLNGATMFQSQSPRIAAATKAYQF